MSLFKFGKYADAKTKDIPSEYLDWIKKKNLETIKEIDEEISRREMVEEANESFIERIINVGYKTLAKTYHPDTGGDTMQMVELNKAAASNYIGFRTKG